MTKSINVLVGMIASGKSSLSFQFAEKGSITICDDSIVQLLHGGNYSLYDNNLKNLYKSIEMHIACSALSLGRTLIVDRGVNVRKQSRVRWIGLAKSMDVPCYAYVLPLQPAVKHAERRFNHDSRGLSKEYWLRVAESHLSQYDTPTIKEGFDKVFRLKRTDDGKFIDEFGNEHPSS